MIARMNPVVFLKNGQLEADILPLGATLSRFRYAGRDLILGFRDPADHAKIPVYAGHLVGPVANRLAGGVLTIDGQTWQMPLNENGITTLHSGDTGLHAQAWQVLSTTPHSVRLTCHLAHGYGGLPGQRTIAATYTLTPGGLTLDIVATSTATTPMNIAHHPYWAPDSDVSQTRLWIKGTEYLQKSANGIATAAVLPVADTPLDFRTSVQVPTGAQIDHCICLSRNRSALPRHVATLTSADGTDIRVSTTEPGLQVYDGAGLPDQSNVDCMPHPLRPFAGIALEPQGWPDAPNHENFPDILIRPGDVYHQITRYEVSQRA